VNVSFYGLLGMFVDSRIEMFYVEKNLRFFMEKKKR
jgi:hypothetical protein